MTCAGLLLAAGAGTRMGGPKALVRDVEGTAWVRRGVRLLRAGGCAPVLVVVGAAADDVVASLDSDRAGGDAAGVQVVHASDWAEGISASLRAGLRALATDQAGLDRVEATVVLLVDLPDLVPAVVGRVAAFAGTDALARATYGADDDARHGHPVLLGRDHWTGVVASARGDRGARDYLAARDVVEVDCSDLAAGHDVDAR